MRHATQSKLSGTLWLFYHALYVIWDAHLDKSKNLHILNGGFSYLSHKLIWFYVCKTLSHSSKDFFILQRLKTNRISWKLNCFEQIKSTSKNKALTSQSIRGKNVICRCFVTESIAAWRSEHFLAWVFTELRRENLSLVIIWSRPLTTKTTSKSLALSQRVHPLLTKRRLFNSGFNFRAKYSSLV